MSIVASVKVYDGIILGADSRTRLTGKTEKGEVEFIKAYDNAKKLFEIEDLKLGILTYGVGNVGSRSVESYINDFITKIHDELNSESCEEHLDELEPSSSNSVAKIKVQFITHRLRELFEDTFQDQYSDTEREDWPTLGVFVGGYSEDNPLPEEWEFRIPEHSQIQKVREPDDFGASWRGISIPFARLFQGYDPRILNDLLGELQSKGTPQETLNLIDNNLKKGSASVVFDGMPIQDAIDFCKFILSTTVKMSSFERGVPSCGGPLDIAVITRKNGFQWERKKEFQA